MKVYTKSCMWPRLEEAIEWRTYVLGCETIVVKIKRNN